jgi:hypothetical protein
MAPVRRSNPHAQEASGSFELRDRRKRLRDQPAAEACPGNGKLILSAQP